MAIVKREIRKLGPGRTDWKKLRETTEEEIQRQIVEDGGESFDFGDRAWVRGTNYVRGLRERLGLTQAEFADRFALSQRTIQEWEQGRSQPDAPARALLRIIAHSPKMAARALRSSS